MECPVKFEKKLRFLCVAALHVKQMSQFVNW